MGDGAGYLFVVWGRARVTCSWGAGYGLGLRLSYRLGPLVTGSWGALVTGSSLARCLLPHPGRFASQRRVQKVE